MKVDPSIEANAYLETTNATEVKRCINSDTIAMMGIRACENHGDHMPSGAHLIFPSEFMKRITAKLIDVIVLPYLPYGLSLHHDEYQMTINIQSSTVVNLIQDICHSIIKDAIRRILVINGHVGNIAPIEIAFRYIKNKYPEVVLSFLEPW